MIRTSSIPSKRGWEGDGGKDEQSWSHPPQKRAGDEDKDEQSWLHPPKNGQEGVKDDQSCLHPALWGGGM